MICDLWSVTCELWPVTSVSCQPVINLIFVIYTLWKPSNKIENLPFTNLIVMRKIKIFLIEHLYAKKIGSVELQEPQKSNQKWIADDKVRLLVLDFKGDVWTLRRAKICWRVIFTELVRVPPFTKKKRLLGIRIWTWFRDEMR